MTSVCTEEFWKLYHELPEDGRKLAVKNYRLWRDNPQHPSVRFKPVRGDLWSVRLGLHYRALGRRRDETVTWVWIGSHAEYDQLLRTRVNNYRLKPVGFPSGYWSIRN